MYIFNRYLFLIPLITWVTFLLLVVPASASEEYNRIDSYESIGDDLLLYQEIHKQIVNTPQDPRCVILIKRFFDFVDSIGYKRIINDSIYIEKALGGIKNIRLRNNLILHYAIERARFYEGLDCIRGRIESEKIYPIREWSLIGPYNDHGDGNANYQYAPELLSESGLRKIGKKIRNKNVNGYLYCNEYFLPFKGIVYLHTAFKVNKPIKVRIQSKARYKAFINNKLVISNYALDYQNERIIGISSGHGVQLVIKVFNGQLHPIRVIATDENDIPIKVLGKISHNDILSVNAEEEIDYAQQLCLQQETDDHSRIRKIGDYFYFLDSPQAISSYRTLYGTEQSIMSKYLLARSLLKHGQNDVGGAFYSEGWRYLNEIINHHPEFIPARYLEMRQFIERKEYQRALQIAERLIIKAPRFLNARCDALRLYKKLGYEMEFIEQYTKAIEQYPLSLPLLQLKAQFMFSRSRLKYTDVLNDLFKEKKDAKVIRLIMQNYITRGQYEKARNHYKEYGKENILQQEYIQLLLAMGNKDEAKKVLFQEIVEKDNSYYYYLLGGIDIQLDDDPGLYWQKFLELTPESNYLRDYLDFNSTEVLQSYPKYFAKDDIIKNGFKKNGSRFPTEVLYKNITYMIYPNGSGRVFCEDIVLVNNDTGVKKWGDFRIPLSGSFIPLSIRIYKKNDGYSETYTILKSDHTTVINFHNLRKGDIIQVVYLIDNPRFKIHNGNNIASSIIELQQYAEPIDEMDFKVILPKSIKLNFMYPPAWKLIESSPGDYREYSFHVNNLRGIEKEEHDGGKLNNLPCIAFSSIKNTNDFIIWYNGMIEDKLHLLNIPEEIKIHQNKPSLEVIRSVYEYVKKNISIQNNVLFMPDYVENTLYRKRGSPEDAILLTKSILDFLGIHSYIALAQGMLRPEYNNYIGPDNFSHILLYIPMDKSSSIWIDYSEESLPCGIVSSMIEGSKGFIILSNDFIIKKIENRAQKRRSVKYRITIDEKGTQMVDAIMKFENGYDSIREIFNAATSIELKYNYIQNIYNGIFIKKVFINNENERYLPLIIQFNGGVLSKVIIGKKEMLIGTILSTNPIIDNIQYPERENPLYITSRIDEQDEYIYDIPKNYSNCRINQVKEISSKYGKLIVSVNKESNSCQFRVTRKFLIYQGKITTNDYNELLKFCLEVNKIESEYLHLNAD